MTLIETLVLRLILLVGIALGALGASFFGALGGAIGFMAGLAAPAVLFSLLNTLDALFRGRVSTSSGTPGLLGKVLDHLFATRRRIFALWVLLWTTVYALGALAYHDQAERLQYTLTFWGAVTTLSVLQALFVLPVLRPAPKAKRGKSLAVTLVLAAMLASALLGGIAAALAHVLQDDVRAPTFALVGLLVFLSSWIVWTVLLIRFVSRDRASSREEILTRLAHQLFAGTVVEALLAIPLDVMIRQRESCYCGILSVQLDNRIKNRCL